MTTDTVGGVWSYSVELCKAFQFSNVHFHLVTTGALMEPAQKVEITKLKNVTVYETEFLLEWMASPWQSIDESGAWLLQLADKLKPDLIHLNCYAYSALPWKVPVIVVAHSDVFSWWVAVKDSYPPAEWNEYFKRVFNGLQQADFIIAPSIAAMSSIRKIYLTTVPGKVIYNGRSAEMFYPARKQPCICCLGRIWDEAKNISLLVEAAKQIPYAIRLGGDTSFGYEQTSTTGANITHLGRLSAIDAAGELSAASIYVLPAKYEPFGLSILEAALSGCALVLGKIASLKEIWKDSAVYVDTSDAAKLAHSIKFLVENNDARFHLAQKAMDRAQRYTTTAMATSYMQVYAMLLKNKKQLAQPLNIF